MEQHEIDAIEDEAKRETAQRIANRKLAQELAEMSEESKKALRNIAGYGGL